MTMFRTALRATILAAAIAAAIPTIAQADATLSIQGSRHNYVYYRDHDIYYAPDTRTYYWMADGSWRQGERLPEDRRGYVREGGINIELDTDRPYERHDYVVSHYRNGPDGQTRVERSRDQNGVVTTTTTNTSRRHYVYYRDHDIYFAPESRTYYWRANGSWQSGRELPRESRGFVANGGIDVELDTDRPYERHDYVLSHYGNAAPTTSTTTERSYGSDGSTRTTTTTTEHSYVYYGDHDIYYAPDTRMYYWRTHGQWRSGAHLPRQYRGYVRSGGVRITLDTDRPYERHDYVMAHYRHHDRRHDHRDMRDDQREHNDRRDDERNERNDD